MATLGIWHSPLLRKRSSLSYRQAFHTRLLPHFLALENTFGAAFLRCTPSFLYDSMCSDFMIPLRYTPSLKERRQASALHLQPMRAGSGNTNADFIGCVASRM